jgi:polysaccharide pyruvyl transferase WcaK-like protein
MSRVLGYPGRLARTVTRRVTRLDPLAYLPAPARAPGERPRVGVVGFFGHGNYGDELFLEVYREHLGGAFALRSLLDPGEAGAANRLGAGVRSSDALVIGGGDIVIPWSAASRYWERTYLRRPVFIAGVGVPMWRQPVPHVVDRLRGFFQDPAVRFVGSRDEESTAWIADNLQPRAPLVTAPDLVCSLTLPVAERPADPPIFGVAVRSRKEPDDLSQVRALCLKAASMGYRVRRIVLGTGKVRTRDLEATAGLDLPDTELVSTDDLDVISRAIGECSVFATMKFHGVIVATMYGVPSIALMPTTKTKNFLRGIDRLDLLSAYSNPELPSWLDRELPPIAPDTVERLHAGGVAHLADLRARIAATIGG